MVSTKCPDTVFQNLAEWLGQRTEFQPFQLLLMRRQNLISCMAVNAGPLAEISRRLLHDNVASNADHQHERTSDRHDPV